MTERGVPTGGHPRSSLELLRIAMESRADDIALLTSTGSSWESWLHGEWWLRCKAGKGWAGRIEPVYREHGVELSGL